MSITRGLIREMLRESDGSVDYRIVQDGRSLTVAKESRPNHAFLFSGMKPILNPFGMSA